MTASDTMVKWQATGWASYGGQGGRTWGAWSLRPDLWGPGWDAVIYPAGDRTWLQRTLLAYWGNLYSVRYTASNATPIAPGAVEAALAAGQLRATGHGAQGPPWEQVDDWSA